MPKEKEKAKPMPNFESILDKKVTETEKPPPKPVGEYLGAILGYPEDRKIDTRSGERQILSFKVKLVAARNVEDTDALDKAGDIAGWPPVNHDIWYDTPEGEWQLHQFLVQVLGIEPEDKTYKEMISESPGKQIVATCGHRPYTARDGTAGQAFEIKSVAAA